MYANLTKVNPCIFREIWKQVKKLILPHGFSFWGIVPPTTSRPKVGLLIFISLIWIPSHQVCYNFMRVLREFVHNVTFCTGLCPWYVYSKNLGQRRLSHTVCICLASLRYAFSTVSSNRQHQPNFSSYWLPVKMHSHIGCICLDFLYCAFSNVSSNWLSEKMHSHIGCICVFSMSPQMAAWEN